MTSINRAEIKTIIDNVVFSDNSAVSQRASAPVIKDSNIGFSIDITGIDLDEAENIKTQLIEKLSSLKGISKINIVLTSSKENKKNEKAKIHIDNVSKIILVAAGKGGVGKSTISALLAHKLNLSGKKVGILDADIYGPSIPNMFALNGKPDLQNNKMIPLENYGIKINSIAFLSKPDAAISWRGPMVSKALYQLLSLTNWGKLDYLIIDTPPGTGDIHLSLLQNYIIDSVMMVTTPQKISAIDVSRAINLYRKFNVPISGIIENMSHFQDSTGNKVSLFSGDSAAIIAKEHNIPVLAKLPITPRLSKACDLGQTLIPFTSLLDFEI